MLHYKMSQTEREFSIDEINHLTGTTPHWREQRGKAIRAGVRLSPQSFDGVVFAPQDIRSKRVKQHFEWFLKIVQTLDISEQEKGAISQIICQHLDSWLEWIMSGQNPNDDQVQNNLPSKEQYFWENFQIQL